MIKLPTSIFNPILSQINIILLLTTSFAITYLICKYKVITWNRAINAKNWKHGSISYYKSLQYKVITKPISFITTVFMYFSLPCKSLFNRNMGRFCSNKNIEKKCLSKKKYCKCNIKILVMYYSLCCSTNKWFFHLFATIKSINNAVNSTKADLRKIRRKRLRRIAHVDMLCLLAWLYICLFIFILNHTITNYITLKKYCFMWIQGFPSFSLLFCHKNLFILSSHLPLVLYSQID